MTRLIGYRLLVTYVFLLYDLRNMAGHEAFMETGPNHVPIPPAGAPNTDIVADAQTLALDAVANLAIPESPEAIEANLREELEERRLFYLSRHEVADVIAQLESWDYQAHPSKFGPIHVLSRHNVGRKLDLETFRLRSEDCAVGFSKSQDAAVILLRNVRGADLLSVIDIQETLRGVQGEYDADASAQLSPKQRTVLGELWKPYNQIAEEQGIAASTVRSHVHSMLKLFGLKNCEDLIIFAARKSLIGLDNVPNGQTAALTGRMREIVADYPTSSYEEIAQALSLSVSTVRAHMHNIYARTGAKTSQQVTLMALRDGLIPLRVPDESGGSIG